MKVSFILLLVVVTVAVTFPVEAEHDELWENFKLQFSKKHHSKEDAKRKFHFIETDKKIKRHNKGNANWKMAHNKFSDMTEEEKKGFLGGKVPDQIKNRKLSSAKEVMIEERLVTYPTSMDLRKNKCLIPPKNQATCGSCWAFATNSPLEFQACNKTGKPISLSEQQMVDCDSGSYACNGGWYTSAWTYLMNSGAGVSTSANYPYVSGTSLTRGYCRVAGPGSATSTRVASWNFVTPKYQAEPIMAALAKYGPIPVTLKVIGSLYNFGTGIYDDPYCNSYYSDANHAVVIVGYGTKGGIKYWIVRNSWGIFWGDGGYFYIKRGVNQCQIEGLGAYVVVK